MHLARVDAEVIGMMGAGNRAASHPRAAPERRGFVRVIDWNLHPDMLPRLAAVAEVAGLRFGAADLGGLRGGRDRRHRLRPSRRA